VYPSVLPLAPKNVCLVNFREASPRYIEIWWVNLNWKDFYGTSEVMDLIMTSIQQGDHYLKVNASDINNQKGIDIAYQVYDDTVWTVNQAILRAFKSDGFDHAEKRQGTEITEYDRSAGGEDSLNAEIMDSRGYTKEKPVAWLRRTKSLNDNQVFTVAVLDDETKKYFYYKGVNSDKNQTINGGPTIPQFNQSNSEINEYCDDQYFYKLVDSLDSKTENLGYWQVHAYPEVAYYPRDPSSGQPIIFKDLAFGIDSAMVRKKRSLDNPNNNDLKYYRDPYLSDSASTIISFAFIDDGGIALNQRQSIWLSGSAIGSKISFEHYPNKMYSATALGLETAVRMLYSNGEGEEIFARTLEDRCPGWNAVDQINGMDIFPPAKRSANGTSYERDWSVDDGVYLYDECPCARQSDLGGKTKAEIRRFIFKPVPTCSYEDITRAESFYIRMQPVLTAQKDQEMLYRRLGEAITLRKMRESNYDAFIRKTMGLPSSTSPYSLFNIRSMLYQQTFKPNEEKCPDTWVDAIKQLGF
jgi:hypothetical protein